MVVPATVVMRLGPAPPFDGLDREAETAMVVVRDGLAVPRPGRGLALGPRTPDRPPVVDVARPEVAVDTVTAPPCRPHLSRPPPIGEDRPYGVLYAEKPVARPHVGAPSLGKETGVAVGVPSETPVPAPRLDVAVAVATSHQPVAPHVVGLAAHAVDEARPTDPVATRDRRLAPFGDAPRHSVGLRGLVAVPNGDVAHIAVVLAGRDALAAVVGIPRPAETGHVMETELAFLDGDVAGQAKEGNNETKVAPALALGDVLDDTEAGATPVLGHAVPPDTRPRPVPDGPVGRGDDMAAQETVPPVAVELAAGQADRHLGRPRHYLKRGLSRPLRLFAKSLPCFRPYDNIKHFYADPPPYRVTSPLQPYVNLFRFLCFVLYLATADDRVA